MKAKCSGLCRLLLAITIMFSILNAQKKEVVAYFTEWSVESNNPYYVKNIITSGSADKITVINYSFAEPGPDSLGNIIPKFMSRYNAYGQVYSAGMSVDGISDDSTQTLKGHFNQLKKLKEKYPHIRILISVGGWTGSTYISDAALTPQSREKFVDSCIDIFIKGNLSVANGAGGPETAKGIFDGIDIDWEFPISGGNTGIHNNPNDNNNLSELYKLFREKLDAVDTNLLLTAAVPTKKPTVDQYNIKNDQKYLNWYCLMTYDFYGGWDKSTGHLTNLFNSSLEPNPEDAKASMDKAVKLFRNEYQVSVDKIIPGAAFYGRGWSDVEGATDGLFEQGGSGTELYEYALNNYSYLDTLMGKGFKLYWDKSAQASWIYNPAKKIFWTLDDVKSIALKIRYIDAYNLRGIMFWEMSGDDKNGTLLNTIYTRNMPDIVFEKQKSESIISSINIITPLSGEILKAGSNVLIETDIKNENESKKKVEFFVDGESIGYNTIAPFDWVWFNVKDGEHEIKTEATYVSGDKTFSQTIKVNVKRESNYIKLWQLGDEYKIGDWVYYNNNIYECKELKVNSLKTVRPGDEPACWMKIN